MAVEITIEDLIKDIKERGLIKIIPERDFDPSSERHPIEGYLARAGVLYYFEGGGVGKEGDYKLKLSGLKIIYPQAH